MMETAVATVVLAGIYAGTYWFVKSSIDMCKMMEDMENDIPQIHEQPQFANT